MAVGETDTLLPVTMPTPLLIDTEVALLIVQESVVLLPNVIVAVETEKLEIMGEVGPLDVKWLALPPQLDIIVSMDKPTHSVRTRTNDCLEVCFMEAQTRSSQNTCFLEV